MVSEFGSHTLNNEFNTDWLPHYCDLKIDLVSHPARAERLANMTPLL